MRRQKKIAAVRRAREAARAEAQLAEDLARSREKKKAEAERRRRLAEWRRAEWQRQCQTNYHHRPAKSDLVAYPCTKKRSPLDQY